MQHSMGRTDLKKKKNTWKHKTCVLNEKTDKKSSVINKPKERF